MFRTTRLLPLAALLAPTFAQGADDCANAQVIAGPGVFAFDNSAATKDGGPDGLCLFFGLDDIENDVWFSWSTAIPGLYTLSTCGQTTVDTKIAVVDSSCAGSVVACGEDACGSLQTEVQFLALAGQTYLVRLGTYPTAAGGTGTFTLTESQPILNTANGHYYLAVSAQPVPQTWDDAVLAAASFSYQGTPGHLVTITDQAEQDFVAANLGDLQWHWMGGYQDVNAADYSEPAGGWRWVTGETFSYTAWHPNEPNNSGGFGAEDYMEFFNGLWNDVADFEHPAGYVIEWSGLGSIGDVYCGPANLNSAGLSAEISAFGSVDLAVDFVELTASSLPADKFAYFINSMSPGFVANPGGSQGNLCLSGEIGRHTSQVGSSGPQGVYTIALDLAQIPTPSGPVAIQPGETWYWQCWYRDNNPNPTSNFTDGIELMFL